MVFKSQNPDITYPTDLTVWEWAFEDPRYSPLFNYPPHEVSGFTNAATQERLDFFQVKEYATYLSTALVKDHGLQTGDTVSIFSQNTIAYPVAMFAILRAGGRVNGASPAYSADEMTSALKTAESKYIMTIPKSIEAAAIAAANAGIRKERIFLMEGELDGYTTLQQLLDAGRSYGKNGQAAHYRIPEGSTNDVCGFLNFSSGTTGLPKAVVNQTPVSGLVRFLNWPVANNDECVMLPEFTMEAFLKGIVKYQITDLSLVPSIIIRLIRDPIVKDYDISCLKRIACGAAPLGPEVIQLLSRKTPWVGFRQSYGMTESCCCLTTHPPEFYSFKYANNGGKLLGSTEVKVIDLETGKELGPNETGEILARGPQIGMGYLANARETAEVFGTDGFLHTGDIGSVDDQGFIHIVDRMKEMIKVKGQQVAPADLEHLLVGHPDVSDCAVLGIPDPYSTERPKAYVTLNSQVQPSDAIGRQLIQYVKEKRVRYKWIKEIEFVSEIPKSPSGKILRRVLREKEKLGERGHVVRDDATERPKL